MKNILMLSNTLFQLMTLVKIVYDNDNTNDEFDIILSDHTKIQKEILGRVKQCNLFKDVYYKETLNFAWIRKKSIRSIPKYILNKKKHYSDIKNFVKKHYDELYVANMDSNYTELLIKYLKKNNPNLKVYIFEDGFMNYSEDFCKLIDSLDKDIYESINGIYLFEPENSVINGRIDSYHIKKIDKKDEKLKGIYNFIFDYTKCEDNYTERVIFFEESVYHDGYTEFNDLELLNQVSDILGKENIFVKRHPRGNSNRFVELGYKTNKDFSIPWEIIVLNNNFENKILITICSGCILTPYTVFNDNVYGVSLVELVNKCGIITERYANDMKNILGKYKEKYHVIKNIDELKNI